jgi:hypothetical protein
MSNQHVEDWDTRITAIWATAADLDPALLVTTIDALAQERSADDPRALFERACARDTAGRETEAEQLYRAALAATGGAGLDDYRRARATIQLASTLRILGHLQESERLLVAELDRHLAPGGSRELHDEARATLALTYLEQGRAAEAAGLALSALAPRLSRYNRSMGANAARWVRKTWN